MGGRHHSQLPPSSSLCLPGAAPCKKSGGAGGPAGEQGLEERLETASLAHKGSSWRAGRGICQYGESREAEYLGSLVSTDGGSILGPQRTSFRISSKERLRGVWRECGVTVNCSEKPGVDSRIQVKMKGAVTPFRWGAGSRCSEPLIRTPDAHCTPDPEGQVTSSLEAEIVEVVQRTFLFLFLLLLPKADAGSEIARH